MIKYSEVTAYFMQFDLDQLPFAKRVLDLMLDAPPDKANQLQKALSELRSVGETDEQGEHLKEALDIAYATHPQPMLVA